MYKLNLYLFLLALFLISFGSEKVSAQYFFFPTLDSKNNCSDAFTLTTRIEIIGIKIGNIYWDNPSQNTGSFGFEVVFKYQNIFTGKIPTSTNNFWTYSYVLHTDNPAIQTANISNNISNVPIVSNWDGTLYTTANNTTYIGSASLLGLQANQLYTDESILKLFNFTTLKLSVNLPCLQADNIEGTTVPILPISLTDFEVSNQNNQVLISWNTMSEINHYKFEIQSSNDAINFNTIGSINSKSIDGNSNELLSYYFIDESPKNGLNYYRLKNFALDGSYEYSEVKVLNIQNSEKQLLVYPNPAHHQITIENISPNSTLELMNTQGQILWQIKISNQNTYQLALDTYPSGLYYLRTISSKQNIQYQKIEVY